MNDAEMEAHRTACTLMLAHLKSYASAARSGMPVEGILHLLEYNLKAIRDWTPDTIAKAMAELGMTAAPEQRRGERVSNFQALIRHIIDSKKARELATEFEVAESTIERWATGVARPMPRLMKMIEKWITAPSSASKAGDE